MKKTVVFYLLFAICCLRAADPAAYDAGEMRKTGRTFYVSTKGSDKNDGTSPEKAFRTIKHGATFLRCGDTLLVAGGEYGENEVRLNVKDNTTGYAEQCGKPGSPVRIMGMPGEKVVLRGGNILKNKSVITLFRKARRATFGRGNAEELCKIASQYVCVDKIELLPFKKICQVKYDSLGMEFPFSHIPEPTSDLMKTLEKELLI